MQRDFLRVTLDTNVIISALLFGGNPKRVILKVLKREFKAFISPSLKSELSDKLIKKFGFSLDKVKIIEREIDKLFQVVYPTTEVVVSRDTKDNMVLETAFESESSIIVTGDKDLLVLKSFRGIKILTPTEFLSKYFDEN